MGPSDLRSPSDSAIVPPLPDQGLGPPQARGCVRNQSTLVPANHEHLSAFRDLDRFEKYRSSLDEEVP